MRNHINKAISREKKAYNLDICSPTNNPRKIRKKLNLNNVDSINNYFNNSVNNTTIKQEILDHYASTVNPNILDGFTLQPVSGNDIFTF